MSLSGLPMELISDILTLALDESLIPSSILRVNTHFFAVAQPLLHSHLRFRSSQQLSLFSSGRRPLSCAPRCFTVILPGAGANPKVFENLRRALCRCKQDSEDGQITLEGLHLQLNSHTRDPNLVLVSDALSMANPRKFVWTGPDPDHHFSIAIVPKAVDHLFKAISTWSHIQHIKLTNLTFPSLLFSEPDSNVRKSPKPDEPLLPPIPSLRTFYLGQATFLPLVSVASMVCMEGMINLEQVRLVDAYSGSIWGARIRRSDVEKAGVALFATREIGIGINGETEGIVARIRCLVTCERETERIVGGDRVEGAHILV